MSDALGVDLGSGDDSAPLVITGPLPESVEQNVEFVRQRRVRDEWRSRVKRGEITRTASETPPPGLSAWLELRGPLVVGAAVWLGLLVVVGGLAAVLGHLFGFRPGPVGLWAPGRLFRASVAGAARTRSLGRGQERVRRGSEPRVQPVRGACPQEGLGRRRNNDWKFL